MVKEAVKHLEPYVPELTLDQLKKKVGLDKLVRLSANENAFGTSPDVAKALDKWHYQNANLYPDSNAEELREIIATQFDIKPDKLIFGNGLDEIIELLSRVLLEPGDEVLDPEPTFSEYALHSAIEGAKLKSVALDESGTIDLKAMVCAVTPKTKMVWICNPNNPTGTFLEADAIRSFIADIPASVTVIVDEAYIDFTGNPKDSAIGLTDEFSNLVVLRTFSKAYGLANFRVGFAVCSEPLIGYLQAVRLPYNLSTFAEIAATAAFKDQAFVAATVKKVIEERKKWEHFLIKSGLPFYDSATNFIFFQVKGGDADELHKFLLENGYLLRNGLRKGWLRVTIGKPEANAAVQKLISKFLAI
ncbi:histidinol-phosphate transaminase [Lentilactobacillus kefiri]|uniref:Histidinol-phosphate aminotransferase n=2 Tax=Lentilactobacillus kefiri TaxID=33962 RepID=A0A8E1RIN9_LENKE|nr:histidinol-phosphate transaminase [Lentilactobacillus kefiri]KRL57663.1 histidinol-phosphate aminotransferase [Lentilactobacillus parakefiri DSM 10551]KRM52173.1 histidinol-phosphate aminotransferase [Lentilactobacillus kefiri DSM 20587 = JCM 5818]MCJ2161203.1 histidinol-phosphate transaminase [Lentilactobacillus kefiri]MCP9368265.1 histidinol-phosphate transaminase [Lentilactobacillus kefiri]MDH5108121.1 histidinol-phosphate transaminase [Lentilactobacillus kefiri]